MGVGVVVGEVVANADVGVLVAEVNLPHLVTYLPVSVELLLEVAQALALLDALLQDDVRKFFDLLAHRLEVALGGILLQAQLIELLFELLLLAEVRVGVVAPEKSEEFILVLGLVVLLLDLVVVPHPNLLLIFGDFESHVDAGALLMVFQLALNFEL